MAFRATLPIALALALAFAAGAQASGETDSCTVGCHSCLGVEISSVMEDSYFSPSASGSFADACTSCDAGYYLAPVDRCIGEGCSCPLGGDCKDLSLDSYVLACTGPDCDCDESVGPCAQTGEEICALLFEVPVAPVRKMLAMDNDISTYMACVRAYAETGQCTEVWCLFPFDWVWLRDIHWHFGLLLEVHLEPAAPPTRSATLLARPAAVPTTTSAARAPPTLTSTRASAPR
jgi:hypothetical protein